MAPKANVSRETLPKSLFYLGHMLVRDGGAGTQFETYRSSHNAAKYEGDATLFEDFIPDGIYHTPAAFRHTMSSFLLSHLEDRF